MPTLARWQATIVDREGNVVPDAEIEVRLEVPGQPLVALWADRAGAVPKDNPFNADENGFAFFHAIGSPHQIKASKDGLEIGLWNYVAIGLNGEGDSTPAPIQREITTPGPHNIGDGDRIVLVNQAVGAAVTLNLPPSANRNGNDLIIKDKKKDAAANNITIDANGTETIDGNLTDVIDINGGYRRLLPLPAGGWLVIGSL